MRSRAHWMILKVIGWITTPSRLDKFADAYAPRVRRLENEVARLRKIVECR